MPVSGDSGGGGYQGGVPAYQDPSMTYLHGLGTPGVAIPGYTPPAPTGGGLGPGNWGFPQPHNFLPQDPQLILSQAEARAALAAAMAGIRSQRGLIGSTLKQDTARLATDQTQAIQGDVAQATEGGFGRSGYLGQNKTKTVNTYDRQRQDLADTAAQQLAALNSQAQQAQLTFQQAMAQAILGHQSFIGGNYGVLGGGGPPAGSPAVIAQIKAGLIHAGRPDLAAFVGTPAWNTWINAESGGNPYITASNGAAGYFQFYGHPWEQPYISQQGSSHGFTMSPYQQAIDMVRYFFNPENYGIQNIENWANQVHAGTYHGWG